MKAMSHQGKGLPIKNETAETNFMSNLFIKCRYWTTKKAGIFSLFRGDNFNISFSNWTYWNIQLCDVLLVLKKVVLNKANITARQTLTDEIKSLRW